MTRVLLTGGAGFIGTHTIVSLVNSGLVAPEGIVVVDDLRRSSTGMLAGVASITGVAPIIEPIDVTDRDAMVDLMGRCGPIDAVIHFAAYKSVRESVEHPEMYARNNVGGTEAVLAAMAAVGCPRIVFSSSCTVYGNPSAVPVTEDMPFGSAASPYGQTKQACERLIAEAACRGQLDAALSLRYFNAAGAHDSAAIGELPHGVPDFLLPFITQTAAGLRDVLEIFGTDYATADGTAVRDYLHVMDLADAHVAALRALLEGSIRGADAINVGTGRGTSVREVVSAFERTTGVRVPVADASRRPGDAEAIWSSCEKAQRVLGWNAVRSLDDIVLSAWAWQQALLAR